MHKIVKLLCETQEKKQLSKEEELKENLTNFRKFENSENLFQIG